MASLPLTASTPCSPLPRRLPVSLFSFLSRLFNDPSRLKPAEFVTRRRRGEPILDVRTPREFAQGHVAGARNVDVLAPDFAQQIERLASRGTLRPDRPVYLYCRSGARSGRATRLLRARGYEEAYNLGGLGRLRSAGVEVER